MKKSSPITLVAIVMVALLGAFLLKRSTDNSLMVAARTEAALNGQVTDPDETAQPAVGHPAGSDEAVEVVRKLAHAIKEKRTDLAQECFGVERIGAGTVTELVKAWEPYGGRIQIEGSRQVSDQTVEVFTPQETVGPEKGSRVVFVVGKKTDGWKIVNVTFPKS